MLIRMVTSPQVVKQLTTLTITSMLMEAKSNLISSLLMVVETWYYAKDNGEIVTGAYSIGGKLITSKKMVAKLKVTLVRILMVHFLTDKDSGERLNNRFLTTGNNVWYYFKDGKAVTGRQNIDGKGITLIIWDVKLKGSNQHTKRNTTISSWRRWQTWITFQDGRLLLRWKWLYWFW